jgi:hypothetical protein
MKKYHSIIKLIVVTAGLVGLGVVAFKYLHNKNDNVEVQVYTVGWTQAGLDNNTAVKIQALPAYFSLTGAKKGTISTDQTQGEIPSGSTIPSGQNPPVNLTSKLNAITGGAYTHGRYKN